MPPENNSSQTVALAQDTVPAAGPRTLAYCEAIREATRQEMARDSRVMLLGQGITDHKGFYGTTLGLREEFGDHRVLETPLAEDGITGVAIGAALGGLRPIHTHIRMDFMLLAMNQLVNIAAKTRSMYGGRLHLPLVVRGVIGRSWGQGAQHSQGLHSLFMHVPGLRVVCPTTPYDAKGLMIASIQEDNPVIFVEHRLLHFQKGYVPTQAYSLPFGKARTLAHGSDVTLVGISQAVVDCMYARACLAQAGISAEVIDAVSLAPLDVPAIAASVAKTGRLVVVDCAWTNCGASAEIISAVGEELGGHLAFRFKRLGFAPVPCPTSKPLENLFYPDAAGIAQAAYRLVHPGDTRWQPEPVTNPEVAEFRGPF